MKKLYRCPSYKICTISSKCSLSKPTTTDAVVYDCPIGGGGMPLLEVDPIPYLESKLAKIKATLDELKAPEDKYYRCSDYKSCKHATDRCKSKPHTHHPDHGTCFVGCHANTRPACIAHYVCKAPEDSLDNYEYRTDSGVHLGPMGGRIKIYVYDKRTGAPAHRRPVATMSPFILEKVLGLDSHSDMPKILKEVRNHE